MAVEHTTWDPGTSGRERPDGQPADGQPAAGRGAAPYPGLAPFEADDERRYFGREDVTELIAFLAEQRPGLPLILVGASGAGKSSLLRAGLVPRLRAAAEADGTGGNGRVEFYDLTVTGVAGLAARVAKAVKPGRPTMTGGWDLAGTASAWGAGSGSPADNGGPPAALIVDHFEAMFPLADEDERNALLSALCELARGTLVVLALRADYYGRAIGHSRLLRALQERQVVLGPMSTAQLRRAVTEPALLAGARAADELVEAVLADMPVDQPAALPLLAHALLAAWNRGDGAELTLADYLAVGGLRDSVGNSAERAYQELTAGQRRLAGLVLPRLVHLADDLPPVRVTAALSTLRRVAAQAGGKETDADAVLAAFAAQRLVTVDAGHARLTHDAVLAGWPRLRAWVEEQDAAERTVTAGEGPRPAGTDQRPAAAARPAAGPRSAGGRPAGDRPGRRVRRLRAAVTLLVVLVLVAAGLAGYAFSQRQRAVTAQQAAVAAAQAADSRAVAFVAARVSGTDPAAGAQLAAAAYAVSATPQAASSLLDASAAPSVARIEDAAGAVRSVSVSPDGHLLVAAADDGSLRLWNISQPGHPVAAGTLAPAASGHPLAAAAFSPDGSVIAVAGPAGVQLWQVTGAGAAPQASPLGQPLAAGTAVSSVAFSAAGHLLAAGSPDGKVRLWTVTDPAHPAADGKALTLPGASAGVNAVAFGDGGTLLAAGTLAGTVVLWKLAGSAAPVRYAHMPLTGPGGPVSSVAFSPDGITLAAGSTDHLVWLWTMKPASKHKTASAAAAGTLSGASASANSVAFSPDGRSLAAGTSDAGVLVWNLATGAVTASVRQAQKVTSVSWDGTDRVAAASTGGTVALITLPVPVLAAGAAPASVSYRADGTAVAVGGSSVQLWAPDGRALLAAHPLAGGTHATATAFSAAGVVAAALSDGTVALLDGHTLAPLSQPFAVGGKSGAAAAVAFSRDGSLLATGAADGTIRLYDVSDPAHPVRLATAGSAGGADSAVSGLAFAASGTLVAAAGADGTVRLWQVAGRSLTAAGTAAGAGTGGPAALAFSPDSKTLAAGAAGNTVRLWNVTNPGQPAPLGTLTGPSGAVRSAAFSPDGTTLAGGGADGTVWLWNVAAPAQPSLTATLTAAAGDVTGLAFSPSGAQLAAADGGTVHLFATSPAAAAAAVCGNLGQALTPAEWAGYVPGVAYRAPCPAG
jgi:WD40 repeat protein